jgi:hypothetical protein
MPLLIAIDYDSTFTADMPMWTRFIDHAVERGHRVVCVTARRGSMDQKTEMREALPGSVDVFFAYDRPKRDYMHSVAKLWPDIWIDDTPEGI